jgi:predicted transcriptional regulator
MQVLLTLKIDPRMKSALKRLADKQFISVSAAVKQAVEKHLEEHDIDWRMEGTEEKSEK